MKEPYKIKDTKLQYYAYRWPRLFSGLNLLLCPIMCGCFYCWTTPRDQLASDLRYDGPTVNERMSDMHFARHGRKFRRRNSLSIDKPVGKLPQILKRQKKPSNQYLSPLFAKLPYEIRIQIYEIVLSDTGAVCIYTVPITIHNDRFHRLEATDCLLYLGTQPSQQELDRFGSSPMKSVRLNRAVLQTCRLVYSEALPLLYVYNQFVFNDLRHLVAFSHTIPQTHFEHIRSIRLEYDERQWQWSGRFDKRTFAKPLREPMQDSFRVIRSLRRLRSIYILFKVHTDGGDDNFPRPDVKVIMKDLHEYHEKVRGATYIQCKVHLLVYVWPELYHQSTEPGLIEIKEDGMSER